MGGTYPHWRITGGRLFTPAPFLVAGIVNVTPDSFSDGGRFASPGDALHAIETMVAHGADMVDIGAESTRPGAKDIGHAEEWRRLLPVLRGVTALRSSPLSPGEARNTTASFPVSIDTFRAQTAELALCGPNPDGSWGPKSAEDADGYRAEDSLRDQSGNCGGIEIINDVSGGLFDPAMVDVVAGYKPGYILGHSPVRPDTMQNDPRYSNVVDTLLDWFSSRMNVLTKAGLPEEHIVLDPCIGFAKTTQHALDIFAGIPRLAALGRPLYFGISRKSFIGSITGQDVALRGTSTQVAVALLARAGVGIHRVHDVMETVATLRLVKAWPQVYR